MERKNIDEPIDITKMLVIMSEGNHGAISVLNELLSATENPFQAIINLDDMNIRGTQIWVGFKDYCKQDIQKFSDCAITRDQGMIEKINQEGKRGNHKFQAVMGGALAMKNRPIFRN